MRFIGFFSEQLYFSATWITDIYGTKGYYLSPYIIRKFSKSGIFISYQHKTALVCELRCVHVHLSQLAGFKKTLNSPAYKQTHARSRYVKSIIQQCDNMYGRSQ